jgi:hypothetical protein
MNKIRMYDSGYIKHIRNDKIKFNNNNISINGKSNKEPIIFSKKKPCCMCEAFNKPKRYHPL